MVILKSVLFILFLSLIIFTFYRLMQTIKIKKSNKKIFILILNIVLLFLIEYCLVKNNITIYLGLICIYTVNNLILNRAET